MFLLLTTLAAFSTSSLALPQFQPIFPLPQFLPQQITSFPWRPIVGGPASLPPWLKPNDAAPETEKDITEVAERIDEEAVAEDSKAEDVEKSYAEYLKLCTTLGIKPISTGSYTQPGYSSYASYGGSSNYPGYSGYTGNTGYTGSTGYAGYPGNTGYNGYTGYTGNSGYAGNNGYASNTAYSGNNGYSGNTGFPSYNYPLNTGYVYYRG